MFGIGTIGTLGSSVPAQAPSPPPDYDPVAAAFFARCSPQPSLGDKAALNAFIVALRDGDILDSFDGLWIRQNDEGNANLNVLSADYTLVPTGTAPPQYVSRFGWNNQGDGGSVNSFLSAQFFFDAEGMKYAQDDAHISYYCERDIPLDGASAFFAAANDTSVVSGNQYALGAEEETFNCYLNDAAGNVTASVTNSSKLIVIERTTPDVKTVYGDGAQVSSINSPSTGLPTPTVTGLQYLGNSIGIPGILSTLSFMSIGKALGADGNAALNAALTTYFAAVHP